MVLHGARVSRASSNRLDVLAHLENLRKSWSPRLQETQTVTFAAFVAFVTFVAFVACVAFACVDRVGVGVGASNTAKN